MSAVLDGRAPCILTEAGARKLTQRIRAKLANVLDLVVQAWEGRAWEPLGYDTWQAYVDAELPELATLRLPVDERREAVAAWAARGMPQRAMAAGLNVAPATVAGDVAAVVPFDPDATVSSHDGRRRPARVRRDRPAPEPPPAMTKRDRAAQLVTEQGDRGLTALELAEVTGWTGGSATGTMCDLRKQCRVRALPVFRRGYAAYVTT
ncbi:hypothetical protein IN07_03320 [Modestobacter caceresii]|uniref:Uncharacterized protein n=1 Tax=Modestobacter caceresii TaxID=1522368 RepID=A0A098YET6_9ACTN|nr:helix-turn-helix domain-containing protein [Modestobacter caceresii]KGH48246.1 hypothetical protein IN07_03320 [Modestobacter caceresii]